jgi:hypothetical protein
VAATGCPRSRKAVTQQYHGTRPDTAASKTRLTVTSVPEALPVSWVDVQVIDLARP